MSDGHPARPPFPPLFRDALGLWGDDELPSASSSRPVVFETHWCPNRVAHLSLTSQTTNHQPSGPVRFWKNGGYISSSGMGLAQKREHMLF